MKNVVGVFRSRSDAERAAERLRTIGFPPDRLDVLSPGETPATIETEQPGMGAAIGGTVGGAVGLASGMSLGAATASLLVPGVGPVIAGGLLGAALLGGAGAVTGATAGGALEDTTVDGLPKDELYVYRDALRQGRSVLVALADGEIQEHDARTILERVGAESLNAARADWTVGVTDDRSQHYEG